MEVYPSKRALNGSLPLILNQRSLYKTLEELPEASRSTKRIIMETHSLAQKAKLYQTQAQILKSLADDRHKKLEKLADSLEHNTSEHNKKYRALKKENATLKTNLRNLEKEKRAAKQASTEMQEENDKLHQALIRKNKQLESFIDTQRALRDSNTQLNGEINELRQSKSFRAGRALASSTNSWRDFLRTPIILRQIRKDTGYDYK